MFFSFYYFSIGDSTAVAKGSADTSFLYENFAAKLFRRNASPQFPSENKVR